MRQSLIMFTCDMPRYVVSGIFLMRIRWFSELNLDADGMPQDKEMQLYPSFPYDTVKPSNLCRAYMVVFRDRLPISSADWWDILLPLT